MNIVFVCGSLEKGKDGVGDYTRKLSSQLIRIGHQCSILALMDKFIDKEISGKDIVAEIEIDWLRLPFGNGHKNNAEIAKIWLNTKQPDWISVQYVPSAYNNKGLPFGIAESIKVIANGKKLHIMFHEMWMGITKLSPLKHKLIGFFQIRIIKRLIKINNPICITTTNKLYNLVLSSKQIESNILSLFSNIDINKFSRDFYINKIKSFGISLEERPNWIFIGIFGSLYPEVNLQNEIEFHLYNANSRKLNLAFISVGRIGKFGLREFCRLKNVFEGKVKFIQLGEVAEEIASSNVQMFDFAISCTPTQHIAKSGVFAFLKLHEIPTRLILKEILPEYEDQMADWYYNFIKRPQYEWSVTNVARAFLVQLNAKLLFK